MRSGKRHLDHGNWHWKYVLKDKPIGEPTISIICSGEGTVPRPHCNHFFIYEAMLVTVTYSLENLSFWKEIQTSVFRRLKEWK